MTARWEYIPDTWALGVAVDARPWAVYLFLGPLTVSLGGGDQL